MHQIQARETVGWNWRNRIKRMTVEVVRADLGDNSVSFNDERETLELELAVKDQRGGREV